VYYANLTNQIVTLGHYPNLELLNTGKAINKGIETNLRWSVSHKVSTSVGYAFLTSTNLVPLVPQNKATLAVDWDVKRAFLHLGVQVIGRRYTDQSHTSQLGDYTLASAKLSVPVRRSFDLFVMVDNMLNHSYEVLPGYPMPGALMPLGGSQSTSSSVDPGSVAGLPLIRNSLYRRIHNEDAYCSFRCGCPHLDCRTFAFLVFRRV
jgi:outer membrane cobalamin receptor